MKLANDLTRRQATLVSKARSEGKAAFFVRGRLTIGPRRADNRSYAQVTAGAGVQAGRSGSPTPTPTPHDPNPIHPSRSPTNPKSPSVRSDVKAGVSSDEQSVTSGGATVPVADDVRRSARARKPTTKGDTGDSQRDAVTRTPALRQAVGARAGNGTPPVSAGKPQPGTSNNMRGRHNALNNSRTTDSGRK